LLLCKKRTKKKINEGIIEETYDKNTISSSSGDIEEKMRNILKYDSSNENDMNDDLLNIMSKIKKRCIIITLGTRIVKL